MEPSGKGWPLPGTPALYALIIVGLATITLSTSSVRAEETTAQSSYPLKSENAIPLGDFRDRKSTRLNSSHGYISYAVFCLKKNKESTFVIISLLALCRCRSSDSDNAKPRTTST